MHAQSQPRPRPANPERAYGVRKTGVRAHAFALLAPVFALMALTLPVSEAHAQAPSITSIKRFVPIGQPPTPALSTANSLQFDVVFGENVTNVISSTNAVSDDFILVDSTGAMVGATPQGSAGVGTNRYIIEMGQAGDELEHYNGDVFLALASGQNIQAEDDSAALPSTAVTAISSDSANYEGYTMDNVPIVEITTDADNGRWDPAEEIVYTFTFNEPVEGFDMGDITTEPPSGVTVDLTSPNFTGSDGDTVFTATYMATGEPDTADRDMDLSIDGTSIMDQDGTKVRVAGSPAAPTVIVSSSSLSLDLSPDAISENGGTAMLTATLDPAAVALVTVTLTPPSGSGTAFTLGSTSLTIAAGGTSATTTVTARNNPSSDGNLEFMIEGAATSAGRNLTGEVTLTIEDDDVFSLPAVQDYTFDAGATVSVTLPEARNKSTAGTVTYVLEGTLPDGLAWDADDRTISGMPTTAAAAVMYTYKATDDRGAATDMAAEDITFTIAIDLALAAREGPLAGDDRLRFDELPVTFPVAVGATATYTLTRADGTALPEWLTFGDPNSRELRLMDETQARGRVSLLYTATAGDFTATLQVTIGDDLERREDRLGEMVGAVGRTLGWDIAHTIRERARADRSGSDTPLRLSGVSENTTLDELVSRGASLDMALNADAADNGSKGGARVWARVGHSQFDSEPLEDYEQDGELTSLHAGMDFRSSPDRLFGAAVGWHDAQVDYEDRGANVEGDLELEILTINPYASQTRDRWHTWGTVGFGVGEMTYTEQSGDTEDTSESNVTLWNAAGGLEYTLGFIGAAELSARGEGMAVSMQTDESDNEALEFGKIRADAYGVRGEVEVGLPIERADGGTMRPFAVLGMRWEDGDGAADGLSAELGGGITARNADFFVDASVRAHTGVEDEVADVLAWGLALGFDRDNDHRGLAVELNHRAGPQPWDPFADNGLAAASDTTNTEATPATLGATTRYGLDYRNGRMTPYNTLRFDGDLLTEVETGIQYRLSDISLGLKHVYDPSANADEHTLKLIGRITF